MKLYLRSKQAMLILFLAILIVIVASGIVAIAASPATLKTLPTLASVINNNPFRHPELVSGSSIQDEKILKKTLKQVQGDNQQIATLPSLARNDKDTGQVLQATTSNINIKIDANTQINGNLTLTDGTNALTLTPQSNSLGFSTGGTTASLTVTGDTTVNQNLSTTSSPTFAAITLNTASNQMTIAGSTLTWSPTAARTLTLPDATDTLAGISATQTLTNKTISGSSNTFSNIPNSALTNSSFGIDSGTGITGGGTVSLGSSLTLSVDDTVVVTLTGTQTLTNKTLTSPIINTPTINVGSDATGDVYYRNADGAFTRLPIGTTDYVLAVSGGVPIWGAIPVASCNNCVFTDPSTTQTITPTSTTAVGLSVAQASGGSVDIFNVTNNAGSTKYFKVDSSGNSTIAQTLTLGTGAIDLLTGTGAPGVGLGSDGDYYFRTDGTSSSTSLYYKVSGAWESAGGGSLQNAYDTGPTITTTSGNDLTVTLASGLASATKFSLTNNHVSNVTDFYLNNANASGTNTNGILIEQTGAGTLTNAINVTQTAGALINGLTFSGTMTKLFNSTNFNVTGAGAITATSLDAGSGAVSGGAFTGTTFNKLTLTAPATSATLTIADGKTLTVNNTITFAAGADGQTFTFPATGGNVTVLGNTTTGSGSIVLNDTPTFTTPVLGAATATTINKLTLTNPGTSATLTIADGKVFTVSNTLTLNGTDSTAFTFPTVSGDVLTSNIASQGITSTQTSGTIFALNDSTALDGTIIGASITLSGSGAQDQTGLQFNLSNASGSNLYDVIGSGSTWKISKTGVVTVASCNACSTISGDEDYVVKFNSSTSIGNSTIFDNGNVGVGNVTPAGFFSVGTNSGFQVSNSGNITFAPSATTPMANISSSMTAIAAGAAGTWTSTINTPANVLGYQAAASYNGYIFMTGGCNNATCNSTTTQSTVYSAQTNTTGAMGSWTTLNYLPAIRAQHTSLAYNGYLFVIGGFSGTAYQSTVYSAPISSTGTIGAWRTLSSLPLVRADQGSAAYNGYLYISGGTSTGIDWHSTVYMAPINGDGTLGSWVTTTYLPGARGHTALVANNGYLFALGGRDTTSYRSTVYSAPIKPDGTVGAWSVTNSLPIAKDALMTTSSNGYIYTYGGYTGSSWVSTVYSAPMNADGTVGTWSTLSSFPTVRSRAGIAIANGYLFGLAGYNGSAVISTAYSTPLQSTALATNTSNAFAQGNLFDFWNNSQSKFSVDFAGKINTSGGINFANITNKPTAQTTSQVDPLGAGSLGTYTTQVFLPKTNYNFNLSSYNGYIYSIAGTGGSGSTYYSTVYMAKANLDGGIGAWNTLTYLPKAIKKTASVISNGYIYVSGGRDGSVVYSTLYSAPINNDGTVGTWSTLSSMPQGLQSHSMVAMNGYLIVAGGCNGTACGNGSNAVSTVYSAPINGNGTVGNWVTTTYLPVVNSGQSTVTANGYIYIIGGMQAGASQISSTVYSAAVNANGTLSNWTAASNRIPLGLTETAAAVNNGYVYILGGCGENCSNSATSGRSTIYSAKLNTDGSVGTWATLGFLPSLASGMGATTVNGYLYFAGGTSNDFNAIPLSTVYSAPLQSTGLAYNTANTFTSGNLLDVWNNNTSKFSVDYNGTVSANGGLNISSLNNKPTANIQSAVDPLGEGALGLNNSTNNGWYKNTTLPGSSNSQNLVTYNNYIFAPGGTGDSTSTVYSAIIKPDGNIGTWSAQSFLPTSVSWNGTAVNNGYLFSVGGYGSNVLSTVYSSKLNSDGTIGAWNTLSSLPGGRAFIHSFTYNNYIFAVGGMTTNSQTTGVSTVYSAPINTNGTIGNWSTLSSLPAANGSTAAAMYNGFIYVMGGSNPSLIRQSTVYVAQIKTDGTITPWTAQTTALPFADMDFSALGYAGYLYVFNGSDASGASTFYAAPINSNNGSIGTFKTVGIQPDGNRTLQNVVIGNNYLFLRSGGNSGSANSTIYSVPLQSTGFAFNTQNTFTNGNLVDVWNNNQSKFSVDYLGGINTQSGINFANVNNKPTANLSSNADPIGNGGTGSYSTLASLPSTLNSFGSALYNNYVYLTGGSGPSAQSTVYSTQVKADGTIGAWNMLTYLPIQLYGNRAANYNEYLFVTGGSDGSGVFQSTVYSAKINNDATIASWNTLTYLPQAINFHTVSSYNGYLFVTGGSTTLSSVNAQSTVYSAPIRSDGTIGSWSTLNYLPDKKTEHTAVIYNGYLFTIGGYNGTAWRSTVYSAPINSNGTIGSWSTLSSLPLALMDQATFIHNGYLFVSGGRDSTNATKSTVYSAPINSNGTIGSWSTLNFLPLLIRNQSAITANGYVFSIGGFNGSVGQSTVYSASLQSTGFAFNTTNNFTSGNLLDVWNNSQSKFAVDYAGNVTTAGKFTSQVTPAGDGATGSYATTTFVPQAFEDHSTVAYNGYLYVTGGLNDATQSTIYAAPINGTGTLGSFSTLTYLPQPLNQHSAATSNGYLFITGGTADDIQSTVYSASIKNDGTIGSFSTLTYLPQALRSHSAVVANGYLFITGGTTGSYQSTVYSAPISADGTIGSFATLNYLPIAVATHGASVYNGYLFVSGGRNANYQSTLYSAPINADGTIGSWSTLTYLPSPVAYLSANTYNGYLYVTGGLSAAGTYLSTSYSAPILNDGTVGAWSTLSSLPQTLSTHSSSAMYNGYLFVTAGYNGTANQSTVYTATLTTSRAFVFNATNQFSASTALGGSASLFTLQNNGTGMFNVDAQGNGRFAGNIYASGAILGTPGNVGDLAENMTAADDSIEAADIVSIGRTESKGTEESNESDVIAGDPSTPPTLDASDASGKLVKSSTPYDSNLVGVISTNPSLTFAPEMPNGKPVALSGKVPVKVTTANGEIKPGDYITSSSIPGVGQKATKPGYVIGKALESFDGSSLDNSLTRSEQTRNEKQGTVMVLVNLTFADPNNFLSRLASTVGIQDNNITIPTIRTTKLSLTKSILDASGSGLTVDEDKLVPDTSVQDELNLLESRIKNQESSLQNLDTNIKRLESSIYAFESSSSATSSVIPTEDLRHAELVSASSNDKTLKQVQGDSLLSLTHPSELISSSSSSLSLDNLSVTSQATFSGMIAAYETTISNNFKSLGQSVLGATTIAGDFTVDRTLSITRNSINSLASSNESTSNEQTSYGILYLQNSPLATNIDLFNGKVTFDKEGNIVTAGDITTSQLKIKENTSAGTFTLKAGEKEITIENNYVTPQAIILVTPSVLINENVGITDKISGKSFKATLKETNSQDIEFSYVIIGQ